LEGTALGIREADARVEDLSPSGIREQIRFYHDSLHQSRLHLQKEAASFQPLPRQKVDASFLRSLHLDLEKVLSVSQFNLHLLEDRQEHGSNLELALDLQEAIAVQVLRGGGAADWQRLRQRLKAVPAFLWQLSENVRRRLKNGPPIDRRFAEDVLKQVPEISGYLTQELPRHFAALRPEAEKAAVGFRSFADFLRWEVMPNTREAYALGEKEYAWRMGKGLGVREPLSEIEAYGRQRLLEIHERMREVAGRIDRGSDVRTLMDRLGRIHPKSDAQAVALYARLSRRAKEFVVRRKLFEVPPDYRVSVVPAPPGMGEAITTAAYFPAPPFDRSKKGFFLVARTGGDPKKLAAHNPYHAASTAVHEAFPGHDLQYAYWQRFGRRIPRVRFLRGNPKDWGESMNVEGYAHYAEELMRAHGFFTPKEELFQLAAQAWRAARIVVDIGLHTREMSIPQAARILERDAFLPSQVALGEAFRYSKWPTQALTYALGKRGIEQLEEEWRRKQGPPFSEARFHTWFLAFGPLPPAAIAAALEKEAASFEGRVRQGNNGSRRSSRANSQGS